jgi:hypothetical protein
MNRDVKEMNSMDQLTYSISLFICITLFKLMFKQRVDQGLKEEQHSYFLNAYTNLSTLLYNPIFMF